jgi:outer membrane lipoprotein SlyB
MNLRYATADSVRKVVIESSQSGLGAVAGGVAAFEIVVKLDSGELRAMVQEADQEFQPGQRVKRVTSGGITRVTP